MSMAEDNRANFNAAFDMVQMIAGDMGLILIGHYDLEPDDPDFGKAPARMMVKSNLVNHDIVPALQEAIDNLLDQVKEDKE